VPQRASASLTGSNSSPSRKVDSGNTISPVSSRTSLAIASSSVRLPPWLLTRISRRKPARATLRAMSITTAVSVAADSVTVPGKLRCSLLLP
jgi:hypothetical protein